MFEGVQQIRDNINQDLDRISQVRALLSAPGCLDIMLPVGGGVGLVPAVVDTEKPLLVLLGDGIFAERTCEQADAVLGRQRKVLLENLRATADAPVAERNTRATAALIEKEEQQEAPVEQTEAPPPPLVPVRTLDLNVVEHTHIGEQKLVAPAKPANRSVFSQRFK